MSREQTRPPPQQNAYPHQRNRPTDAGTESTTIQTLADLRRRGLDQAITRAASQEPIARVLLLRANFPGEQIPDWKDSNLFWEESFRRIDVGVIPGNSPADGFEALLAECARQFPGNQQFRPWHPDNRATTSPQQAPTSDTQPAEGPSPQGTGIVIRDYNGRPDEFFDQALELAQAQGIQALELVLANDIQISLFLPNGNPTEASRLVAVLQTLQEGLEVRMLRPGLRDYFFQRLFGEGPDGGRFECTNVPASTLISEIATAIVDTYGGEGWSTDDQGLPRSAVADRIRDDDQNRDEERLDTEQDLDEAGVQEDDILQIGPEATAGSVNVNIREQALARARAQIQRFARKNPERDMRVFSNAMVAPTQYIITFTASGWAPPHNFEDQPEPIEEHTLSIDFPPTFPMKAPLVMWRSPIFHPNIHPQDKIVCLGDLMDGYVPGMDMTRLCQLLIDIATYRNYEIRSYLDDKARSWAMSDAGKERIKARGGKTVDDIINQIGTMSLHKLNHGFGLRRITGTMDMATNGSSE